MEADLWSQSGAVEQEVEALPGDEVDHQDEVGGAGSFPEEVVEGALVNEVDEGALGDSAVRHGEHCGDVGLHLEEGDIEQNMYYVCLGQLAEIRRAEDRHRTND